MSKESKTSASKTFLTDMLHFSSATDKVSTFLNPLYRSKRLFQKIDKKCYVKKLCDKKNFPNDISNLHVFLYLLLFLAFAWAFLSVFNSKKIRYVKSQLVFDLSIK